MKQRRFHAETITTRAERNSSCCCGIVFGAMALEGTAWARSSVFTWHGQNFVYYSRSTSGLKQFLLLAARSITPWLDGFYHPSPNLLHTILSCHGLWPPAWKHFVTASLRANIQRSAGALTSGRLVLISLWVAANIVSYLSVCHFLFRGFGAGSSPFGAILTVAFRRQLS